ncbi:ABC transporter [Hirsutella rhossiliensis]|uniref:ABC transporter domain-containing protein n=1 Tax=Hirsutella rhossiliensis TaxID=111463 RepID=A0A9P8N2S0_9HYPO|nr:ABC transporter domain-containing protein [Hirsutella rhossiliensis]KAH0965557.1 ABC transporter domain-containing protein [Hirsutella rhossiliensis]
MENATVCDDGSFGPAINGGCRGNFDFTLLFEQSFLSITPSSLFLLLSAARLSLLLSRRRRQVSGTRFQLAKLAAVACYGAVQAALLVLWARTGVYGTRTSLAAAVLSFVDVFALATLSWVEHGYSPRPSALINIYLLLSVLFDAVQARTLWLKNSGTALPVLFTTSLAVKIGLLVLESLEKDRFLSPLWRHRSPEDKSGVFSRGFLLWLRRILVQGRKRILYPQDLYALASGLETRRLSGVFWTAWSARSAGASSRSIALALVQTLKWSLLAPVAPRLAQGAFTICQPLLLREFLRYLQGEDSFAGSTGYGFIGAYGLVYCGLAISTCVYWRLTYKCLVKMRGCLVAAIYRKTTDVDPARYDMTAPVALMSTDMERILQGCKDFHEIWANALQVAISVWLLYRDLGIACVAPAVVAVLASFGSLLMSSYADNAQRKWMEATQARVGATVKAIAAIKIARLLGLSGSIDAMLRGLRAAELHAARYFRYIEVLTATLSFAPLLLSPVFTFMIFVIQGRGNGANLDTTKIFTSLSLLQLMTQPLVWLFQAIPLFVASLGCLGRIGKYLDAQPKTENRILGLDGYGDAIAIRNGEFGWTSASPVLRDVNVDIPASRLTMVVGPVASGKSSFSKAIIGELPFCKGQVRLRVPRPEIAYCDQNPFLVNGTLQQNIVGFSDFESGWYDTVVRAVDLTKDISSLSEGNDTRIGSKGVILSGGQRQRVAIARAIYARTPLVVFDDVLSGLDAVTKEHVFEHVFGPRGLLRKGGCTVVLSTHDVDLLPEADHVIALGKDGRVADSGTFGHLSQASEYIKSLAVRERQAADLHGAQEASDVSAGLPLGTEATGAEAPEDMTRRLGDASIYKYLYNHIGLWRFWAAANATGQSRDGYYMGVYAAFQSLALVFLALFAGHTLTSMAVRVGASLHQVLLRTVMAAPVSFFSSVDVGITTNRFSQDVILIDGDLPMALLETVSAGLVALAQSVLIAIAAPYVAIAYPFLAVMLYGVQSFYLRTSRQLRFLDLEAKSPLYTHFLETLQGLATIRSFGWSGESNELNHELVDASQRPLYLLYMVQRWLQLVLELLIAATAVILIAVAVKLQSTSAGFIGVALVNLMSISQELKMIVIHWTNLETSLSALARTKSFEEKTPSENKAGESNTPQPPWPQTGHLRLDSISARYDMSEKGGFALRDVSIDIPGGQKVAICGRSGSGKSSLVMALARMIDLTCGSITVDGVDLSTVPRSVVRSALNIIPQEPYFFHRTLAQNLDSSGSASAAAMRSALEKVQLWDVVESAGGLDSELDVETLSQGQRQLLALARAVLRPGRIVVLDEATSNSSVDKHVAEVMQRIIREEFKGRTVIAVAHQLSTIIDLDHIMVMDAGQLVESASPAELLSRDSIFKRLCDMQGVRIH